MRELVRYSFVMNPQCLLLSVLLLLFWADWGGRGDLSEPEIKINKLPHIATAASPFWIDLLT